MSTSEPTNIQAREGRPVGVKVLVEFGAEEAKRLRRPVVSAAVAALVAAVLLSVVVGSAAGEASTLPKDVIVPERSIGPVRLGESLGQVSKSLGRGRTIAPRFRRYESGRLFIRVGFTRGYHVDSLATESARARLYGHPLTEGYQKFKNRLVRRGWKTFRCEKTQIATHRGPHVATIITWSGNRSLEVNIAPEPLPPGSPGQCGTGSPANPAP